MGTEKVRIAIPVVGGAISEHFGHSEKFEVYTVKDGKIEGSEDLVPPPHEPGVIPKWLNGIGANVIITGGIGRKAVELFNSYGITVVSGVSAMTAREAAEKYVEGNLDSTGETCSH